MTELKRDAPGLQDLCHAVRGAGATHSGQPWRRPLASRARDRVHLNKESPHHQVARLDQPHSRCCEAGASEAAGGKRAIVQLRNA